MGWNGSTLSRHLVTPAHVKTRRGATALGASGQTRSALPCRPGNSLVAQGEVPSTGNGTMRQVFFTAGGIFFRAPAALPASEEKRSCLPGPEGACHKKDGRAIDLTGMHHTPAPHKGIRTTRKAGGLLWPCKGLLPAAPKDAGFHAVQAQCPCRLGYPLKGS